MKTAGKIKRKYNTYHKVRLALFVKSYAAYCIQNHLKAKYKIDSNLKKSQLCQQFSNKRAIPEISRLSRTLNLNYHLLWRFAVLNKRLRLNPRINKDEKIKAYLAIENEIATLKVTRQEKENIIHEDYEKALLSPAIERVAGNSLRNIKNDDLFEKQLEELQKKYRNWYREVANNYKLTTLRTIAFILRLISS